MNNKVKIGGFGKGWGVIFFCMAMFFFFVGFCTDGNNISAPAAAAALGLDATTGKGVILTQNSYAGLIGIIIYILMSQLGRKIGAKLVACICLIISGIAFYFVGNPTSLVGYTVAYTFLIGCSMSAGYVAGGALVAQWFPKRKGIVMGYTTMGLNIASALWILTMNKIAAQMGGFSKAVIVPCVAVCVLAVIGLIFIKNTPQEKGIYPDNVSKEEYEAGYDTKDEDSESRWTTLELLKTKEVWTVGLATGILQLCSTGVMSQLVDRNIELGLTPDRAVYMMTIIALVGIFGSWFIGILDDKFGTKKTMMAFTVWYALAIVANVMGWAYLAVFMIGMSIGGSANFMSSFPTSVFGRQGFEKMNSVVFPIQAFMTCIAFLVDGIAIQKTGQIRVAYIVLIFIALANAAVIFATEDHKYNLDWKEANK